MLIGTPITKSKCPTECNICFNACSYKILSGNQWNIGVKCKELIDYKLCNHTSEYNVKYKIDSNYKMVYTYVAIAKR